MKRKSAHANAWQKEKELEQETGVTAEHKKKIETLSNELRERQNSMRVAHTVINASKYAEEEKMSAVEEADYTIKMLADAIDECVSVEKSVNKQKK